MEMEELFQERTHFTANFTLISLFLIDIILLFLFSLGFFLFLLKENMSLHIKHFC